MPRFRRPVRLAGFLLLQFLSVLVLLEGVGRGLDPLGVSYFPEMARYLDTLVLEEPIGYRNRPGLEGEFFGVPVRINRLGLRDRPLAAKGADEYRILAMGDSVPFGIGVRAEETFPARMEQFLNERHPNRRFRVVDMGVPSYNTEQELIQLESLGLSLQPDAVLLLFSPNDIEPKLWVLDKRRRWHVDLIQRSYAGSLLYLLFRETRQRLDAFPVPPARAGDGFPPDGGPPFAEYRPDSPPWQAIDRSLTEINRRLRARRIPFVLFSDQAPPAIGALLDGVARREGFALVDLKRPEDPRWAGQDERLFHNSYTDAHPSPLGHWALAILMTENLERLIGLSGD